MIPPSVITLVGDPCRDGDENLKHFALDSISEYSSGEVSRVGAASIFDCIFSSPRLRFMPRPPAFAGRARPLSGASI